METELSTLALILMLAIVVATIAGMWKAFEKAGKAGWKALIPIYNIYIMLRISGHSGWWLAALFLPVLAIVLGAMAIEVPAQFSPGSDELSGMITGFMNLFVAAIQVAMIVSTVMLYDVARSFGKGLAFTLGIGILPFIFWPILGFGKTEYRGPVAHPNMVEKGSGAHVESDADSEETADDHSDDEEDDDSNDHDDHHEEHHDNHGEDHHEG